MSLALARKYRPAVFDDLIGQEAVSKTLAAALESGRLSHAYLFSGLRGSGKTSTARIFAKALLCEKGPTAHPCGECAHCIMASENRHMDIVEMDAASNRGIDDIKELIEHTKYKPGSARYKIFIVDEVHMLTTQAFNALLKTLEEPPDFVKFILATTDPLKLPATILSRTQHFRFKKIPQPLIEKHLTHILHLEKVDFEPEAIAIIARNGAGSLRDSLTLLDQAIVYADGVVDVATVTGMLGIIEPGKLEKLVHDIQNRDREAVLSFLKEAAEFEAEMILDELTLYLKSLLLENRGTLSPIVIERFFRIIAESKQLLGIGAEGEFVLSLTLLKMIEAMQIKEIDTVIKELEKELRGIGVPQASSVAPSSPASIAEKTPNVITITEEEIDEALNQKADTSATLATTADAFVSSATESLSTAPSSGNTLEQPLVTDTTSTTTIDPSKQRFETLLRKIYDRDYDLGDCFERNIEFVSFENNLLTWESTAEGEDLKMLKTAWGVIRTFVQEIFGIETQIRNLAKKKVRNVESKESKEPHSDNSITNNTQPLSDENAQTPNSVHNDADSASMLEEVEMKSSCIAPDAGETEAAKEKDPSTLLEEPMIKAAMELFSPKKVRIKRNT